MTSASAREHGASLALGFRIAALQQTVYLSEARVFNYASTNKHFLRGFEGGINDCGLYVGDQTLSDGTQTDKMFELDKLYRTSHEKPVLPIEIKTISPKGNGNANMAWSLSFSRKQYDTCQAVLVNTVKEPDLIALIPMHYIRQRIGNPAEDGDKIADFIRPLWTIHPAQAYPPEMAPFILPIAMLGRALESMRDYAVGATKQWYVHNRRQNIFILTICAGLMSIPESVLTSLSRHDMHQLFSDPIFSIGKTHWIW